MKGQGTMDTNLKGNTILNLPSKKEKRKNPKNKKQKQAGSLWLLSQANQSQSYAVKIIIMT